MVVFGLVTTKTSHLEDQATLTRRIQEASTIISLDRLALSTQCGFSSSILGNMISPLDQAKKLKLVVTTAKSIWG